MKIFSATVVIWACLTTAAAQPRIGAIEIYGARRTPVERIRKALGAAVGDPLPKSKAEAEERIEAVDGVLRARLEAWCCELGQAILYVGIEERGGPRFETRELPGDESVGLPEDVMEAYSDFAAALGRATAEGDLREDLSRGHSLMENIACRVAQQRLEALAEIHAQVLLRAVAEAADPDVRAVAAYVAGYVPDKAAAAGPLQLALRDPDPAVRRNAARALKAIAYLALTNRESGLRVQPTWFVEMLNSTALSDRLEAAEVLLMYVERGDEGAAAQIRERALDSLAEMARWRHLAHALPAYLLLGAVAGVPAEEIERAWEAGEREKMLERISRQLRSRRR
ncbi:MAG: HEAT repeat domain-containing protein [Bryobacteraceae bacterium]|nr:HEAT repeat domain-containing protein [Bryobacteraceae bacterium]